MGSSMGGWDIFNPHSKILVHYPDMPYTDMSMPELPIFITIKMLNWHNYTDSTCKGKRGRNSHTSALLSERADIQVLDIRLALNLGVKYLLSTILHVKDSTFGYTSP